jgi:hypothetical protein
LQAQAKGEAREWALPKRLIKISGKEARPSLGTALLQGKQNIPNLRIPSQKRWGFVIIPRARFWRVNFSNSFLLYKKDINYLLY